MSRPTPVDIRNLSRDTAEIFFYSTIESGSAAEIVPKIAGLKVRTLNVRINSRGGSVFDGLAIYNALADHPANVVVHVDGVAASAASVIAMAGDEIVMADNALMMVHRSSVETDGNAADLRSRAALLEQIDGNMSQVYAKRTGLSREEVVAMLAAETWLTAAEALAKGFATRVTKLKEPVAFDVSGISAARAALSRNASADSLEVTNAIRSEFVARLAARDREIATLKIKLADAEANSASKLGVPPIRHIIAHGSVATPSDILARYRELTGDARQDFYSRHSDSIWKAHEARSAVAA